MYACKFLHHEFSTLKSYCSYNLCIHHGVVWRIIYRIESRSWVIVINAYFSGDIGFNPVTGIRIAYFHCFFWRFCKTKLSTFSVLVSPHFFLSLSAYYRTVTARRIILISDVSNFAKTDVYPKFGWERSTLMSTLLEIYSHFWTVFDLKSRMVKRKLQTKWTVLIHHFYYPTNALNYTKLRV